MIALVAVAICGCTQRWTRAGASEADFRRDHQQCVELARLGGPVVHQGRYERCMATLGYTKR